jgi:hypothetical protein
MRQRPPYWLWHFFYNGGPRSKCREYILVDERKGAVIERLGDAFPTALARRVGALKPWEDVQ